MEICYNSYINSYCKGGEMQQQGDRENSNKSNISKRKKYSEPKLVVLGKVSELTAGGSGTTSEYVGVKPNGSAQSNHGQPFQNDDRC